MTADINIPFRDKAQLAQAVATLIPIPGELSIPTTRLYEAFRALLIEAVYTMASVLRWSCGAIGVKPATRPSETSSKAIGHSLGSYSFSGIVVRSPVDDVFYWARSTDSLATHHPLAQTFNARVGEALRHGLETALAISRASRSFEAAQHAYEMLTHSFGSSVLVSLLREFIEQPLTPFAHFMLGHVPFTPEFQVSKTVYDWLATVASITYEGEPVRTGIAVESGHKPLKSCSFVRVYRFSAPVQFHGGTLPGQILALADGHRSFLIVTPALQVVGLAVLVDDLDRYVRSLLPEGNVNLPFDAMWIQVRSPQRFGLFGSHGVALLEIGQIRNGAFVLSNRVAVEESLAAVLTTAIDPDCRHRLPSFVRHLVTRADAGHGAGVVVGDSRTTRKGSRLTRPLHIDDNPDWLQFLNPDGAVLVNRRLKLVRYGVMLPQPRQKRLPTHGTRHNALAAASSRGACVSIAISDDGILSVFRNGESVLRA
jgi:hypothetical protein